VKFIRLQEAVEIISGSASASTSRPPARRVHQFFLGRSIVRSRRNIMASFTRARIL
jgi:hypothetical protein